MCASAKGRCLACPLPNPPSTINRCTRLTSSGSRGEAPRPTRTTTSCRLPCGIRTHRASGKPRLTSSVTTDWARSMPSELSEYVIARTTCPSSPPGERTELLVPVGIPGGRAPAPDPLAGASPRSSPETLRSNPASVGVPPVPPSSQGAPLGLSPEPPRPDESAPFVSPPPCLPNTPFENATASATASPRTRTG